MSYLAKVLLKMILALGFGMVLSIWIFPTPGEHYEGGLWGWWTGCCHGGLMVPNWIWSLYDETRLFKASSSSTWYDVCWWVAMVASLLSNYIKPFFPLSDGD